MTAFLHGHLLSFQLEEQLVGDYIATQVAKELFEVWPFLRPATPTPACPIECQSAKATQTCNDEYEEQALYVKSE
jgi:hypothetical protein